MARSSLVSTTRAALKESPREIFNWWLLFNTCVWSFSGVAKGFDEGLSISRIEFQISSPPSTTPISVQFEEVTERNTGNIASVVVMKSFMRKFGLDTLSAAEYANAKGWIVSIATAGAVFGCLACSWLTQRLGRKWTMQLFTAIYMAGILGQTFSGGRLGGLYVSRLISGFGIGGTTVLPSIYISEVISRPKCTAVFIHDPKSSVSQGPSASTKRPKSANFRSFASVQIAPAPIRGLLTLQYACCQQLGVVFGFFFNYGITRHHQDTQLQWQLPTGLQLLPAVIWGIGMFFCPESPRFLLARNRPSEALRVLAGLRGLPEHHHYVQAEFHGTEQQLNHELEAVAGASQVDLLRETFSTLENRRRFVLMFMAHLFARWSGANAITQYSPTIFGYLGIDGEQETFLATGIYAIVKFTSTLLIAVFVIDFIGRRRSLMAGITLQITTLVFVGAYLGVTSGQSASDIASSPSASAASVASIVAIYLHAVAWSMGWFSIPYLVSAEVFPVRIRGLCVSILMAAHWAFYFACSRAMPSLLVATHRYGAFAFFASICVLSLAYVFVAMPETSGRSLESMDKLFQRPWYTVFKIAYPRQEDLATSQYSRHGNYLEDLEGDADKSYHKVNHVESAT